MTWLEDAARTEVIDVLPYLGREYRRSPSSHHCACPACAAERRHQSRGDRRGAVGIPHSRPQTWHCHECDAAGDTVDFVSAALFRARFRDLDAHRKAEVREWFREMMGVGRVGYTPPPCVEQPRVMHYPPEFELRTMWADGIKVSSDKAARDYLAFRGIDAEAVARQDLAIALGWSTLPAWARCGESNWSRSAHRLLVPLYDARGVMRSLLARSVEREPRKKSVAPGGGYQRAGLLMGNRVGVQMLRGKAKPALVVIREGEIDLLIEATTCADDTAVLAVISGSWTPESAARIPNGAHVVVATDADKPGDKYAEQIEATLRGRVTLERKREAA